MTVNVDPPKNLDLVRQMWADLKLDLPLSLNNSSDFLTDFEIQVLPSYYLIKDNKKLLLKIDGATDWSDANIQNLILDQI